jgi:hypothetical protein
MYDLRLFYLRSLFHGHNWGVKQGLGVVGLYNHRWVFFLTINRPIGCLLNSTSEAVC